MFVVPEKTANQALLNAAASADIELFEMALACGANIHSLQQRDGFEPMTVGEVAMQSVLRDVPDCADIGHTIWMVQKLISLGVDLNRRNNFDRTNYFLRSAILSGHSELVQLLLDNGAVVPKVGKAEAEKLRWAATAGMGWLVDRILKQLPQPASNIVPEMTRGMEIALCEAVYHGHREVVEQLLDFGVNVEAKNEFGDATPLMEATRMGHEAIVQLLRQRGANIMAVGGRGETVLLSAVGGKSSELAVELLGKGANPAASNVHGNTPLHYAGIDDEVIDKLIANGASLLARDHSKHAVLHGAAAFGNLKLAQACLDAGEKVDTADDWGYTPLMRAAASGQVPMMEFLASHGANLNEVAHYESETPLYFAIEHHQVDAIAWLLKKNVSLSHVIESVHLGEATPLGLAACLGQPDTVRVLLDAGADIHFRTPESGATALLKLPSEFGMEQSVACYELLKRAGSNLDERDNGGDTTLILASMWGDIDLALRLIEDGADIDAIGEYGTTALHYAAERGHLPIVKALLERGADASPVNYQEKTALDLAFDKGQLRIIQLFAERGMLPSQS